MITGGEVIKDLDNVIKKVEFLRVTFPKNDLWPVIHTELQNILKVIKKDIKLYGY